MIKRATKSIGILGGMGPQASARMLEVMISMASSEFDARNGDDFPEIILDSIPVPDFISDTNNTKPALKMLNDRVKKLNLLGVSHFAIACNTARIFINDLSQVSDSPFISMIDEVAKEVLKRKIKKIGLLASPQTIKFNLYQKALKGKVETILPSDKEIDLLENVIRNIISGSGKNFSLDTKRLLGIAESLEKRRAEGIILGCTELPIVFLRDKGFLVFDSVEILSRALLRKHYK